MKDTLLSVEIYIQRKIWTNTGVLHPEKKTVQKIYPLGQKFGQIHSFLRCVFVFYAEIEKAIKNGGEKMFMETSADDFIYILQVEFQPNLLRLTLFLRKKMFFHF